MCCLVLSQIAMNIFIGRTLFFVGSNDYICFESRLLLPSVGDVVTFFLSFKSDCLINR